MRFRTLWGFPSGSGYLSGFSFWRTCAYSLAYSMGRAINSPKQAHAANQRFEQQLGIKMKLMEAGILPYPGERKAAIAPRRAAYAAQFQSAPLPTRPSEITWRPKRKAANFSASRPAMIKPSGGLRGSTATKWR